MSKEETDCRAVFLTIEDRDQYANEQVIKELEMICAKFAIEIGSENEEDYRVEISMHEVFERLEELRQQ